MANGNGNSNLLSENVDPKTWKGYVVGKLENLSNDIKEVKGMAEQNVKREDFEKFVEKIDKIIEKCQDCNVDELNVAVFGDPKSEKMGVLEKFSNLSTAFAIKSGIWAALAGGLSSAMVIIIYIVMKR